MYKFRVRVGKHVDNDPDYPKQLRSMTLEQLEHTAMLSGLSTDELKEDKEAILKLLLKKTKKDKVYIQGDIVETNRDLRVFNSQGAMGPKFELLDEPVEDTIESLEAKLAEAKARKANPANVADAVSRGFNTVYTDSGQKPLKSKSGMNNKEYSELLSSMNLKELQSHANSEGIDLKGLTKKEEIIRALVQAQYAQV